MTHTPATEVPTRWRYQVVVLGEPGDARRERLKTLVQSQLADLGLQADEIDFFDETDASAIELRSPVAAVFLGSDPHSAVATAAAANLVAQRVFVLPVVTSLADFKSLTPSCLHPFNGVEIPTEAELIRVASRLTEELGLVRRRRHVFISYCRRDAERAANQLYGSLDARGWRVFLDTHSVSTGVAFQDLLWDRLSDADIVLFLDSPGAKTSGWVQDELATASNIGMGLVQVVWPGHTRAVGSDLAYPHYLAAGDLRSGQLDAKGGRWLRAKTVDQIVRLVESQRARSLASRRERLVGELAARADDLGLMTVVHPERFIEVSGTRKSMLFVPTTGAPTSSDLHRAEGLPVGRGERCLLYDPVGLRDEHRGHLDWLSSHLPIRAVKTTDLRAWLGPA